jgi:probable F420-dependent oxidoreductase
VADTVVDAARQALGPVGVCLPVSFTSTPSADLQREAARRLEHAGYSAVWTNEVIGKDALVQLAVLLAATERMVFGTCIANIWARPAQTMHAAAAQLAQAYPGRFVLGLGVGYPEQATSTGQEFGNPLATMRDYLDRMDSPTWPPVPDVAYPRIIAANGPKMLALAGDIADGALPAGVPPEYTAQARQALGPDKLLVVGVSVVVDGINAMGIVAEAREHLTAGADHVTLLLPIGIDFAAGIEQLEQLAPALVELGDTARA